MTSTTANYSFFVNETTTNKPISSKTSDVSWIVGWTIGAVAICIGLCIFYCLNRKYKLCSKSFKRQVERRRRESLTDVITIPTSPEQTTVPSGRIPNRSNVRSVPYGVEEKLPELRPSTPPSIRPIHHTSDVSSLRLPPVKPSLHSEGDDDCYTSERSSPSSYRRSSDHTIHSIYEQYLDQLNLGKSYLNVDYDRCYCSSCYHSVEPDFYEVAKSNYTAPRGWTRVGLKIDQTFADDEDIFNRWYTTFYAVSRDYFEDILQLGFIPLSGDHLPSGRVFRTAVLDTRYTYTSPSIHYASDTRFCPVETIKINDQWYDVKIVLQCKQNPQGIIRQPGYRRGICSIIAADEIEWKTNQRSSVVPYGLLIRALQHRCTGTCTHIHPVEEPIRPSHGSFHVSNPSLSLDRFREKPREHMRRSSDTGPRIPIHRLDRPVRVPIHRPVRPAKVPVHRPVRPAKVPVHRHVRPVAKHPLPRVASHSCPNDISKQYSINLQMNRVYFNFQYNRCYCLNCYSRTKPDHFTFASSIYTAPRGWFRVGLQVDHTFANGPDQIFKRWYTTFYGTSKEQLQSIINNRFIPFPGDQLLSGETFTTHLSDKHHVYTSPSIHYASLSHVCPIHTTKINNEWYDVQVVLECKQNPERIIKQRGCRDGVCSIIPDNEIEWKTDQRSSVVPYGLLIHALKHRCANECAHRHS